MTFKRQVKLNQTKLRIDKFLAEELKVSRSQIKNALDSGLILVNHKQVKANYQLRLDDVIEGKFNTDCNFDLEPVNLNLNIIYEDQYLAVINKPKGLVVHPSKSYTGITLVNGLKYQFKTLGNTKEPERLGIVHRLDKDTSGLLIISKDDKTHELLKLMFSKRQIKKEYLAICVGTFKNLTGEILKPIQRNPKNRLKMSVSTSGRLAITKYQVLSQNAKYAYLRLELITGRTHQIRVHLKSISRPVLGDPVYGGKHVYGKLGQYLHAYKIEFRHPITKEKLSFKAELPEYFTSFLDTQKLSE